MGNYPGCLPGLFEILSGLPDSLQTIRIRRSLMILEYILPVAQTRTLTSFLGELVDP
jgi:hypothetical protein